LVLHLVPTRLFADKILLEYRHVLDSLGDLLLEPLAVLLPRICG
jgi:hypothetical protein